MARPPTAVCWSTSRSSCCSSRSSCCRSSARAPGGSSAPTSLFSFFGASCFVMMHGCGRYERFQSVSARAGFKEDMNRLRTRRSAESQRVGRWCCLEEQTGQDPLQRGSKAANQSIGLRRTRFAGLLRGQGVERYCVAPGSGRRPLYARRPLRERKTRGHQKREIPDPALAHENRLKMLRGSATRAARGARLALASRARALSAFRDAYLVYTSA